MTYGTGDDLGTIAIGSTYTCQQIKNYWYSSYDSKWSDMYTQKGCVQTDGALTGGRMSISIDTGIYAGDVANTDTGSSYY